MDPNVLLSLLADAVKFLGHASFLTSLKRREFLKPDIARPCQSVCNKSNAITACLFRDELPKHIKEIGEVSKIFRKLAGRPTSIKNMVSSYKRGSDTPSRSYSQRSGRKSTFVGYRGRGSYFRDRFLSLLWLILGFLPSGLLFSFMISYLLQVLMMGVYEFLQQLEVLKQTLCELGFTVNVEKSQLVPVNEILSLGFIIDSIAKRLQLPVAKLAKIVSARKSLLAKHQPSVRDVAKVTALLVSAPPAVNYLEMHYRSLDLCNTRTLSGSLDYVKTLSLSSQARSDLQWVIENIAQCNGRLFQVPEIDIYIQSDASLIGWGAVSGSLFASGRWSQSECEHHINYLQLLASFDALHCFVSNSRSIHVRFAVDNSTAVAYINNMGVYDPSY